jgi:hypothetical protein
MARNFSLGMLTGFKHLYLSGKHITAAVTSHDLHFVDTVYISLEVVVMNTNGFSKQH